MLRPSKTTGAFSSVRILAKSGSRNSFHSVTIASASAPGQRVVALVAERDAVAEDPPRRRARLRIVRAHRRTQRQQPLDDRNRRRLAHVVGPRLERQPPERNRPALRAPPKCAPIFSTSRSFCDWLTSSTALQDLEVVARDPAADFSSAFDVLRKAAAAVADAGKQKRRADAAIRRRSPCARDRRRRRPARRRWRFRS